MDYGNTTNQIEQLLTVIFLNNFALFGRCDLGYNKLMIEVFVVRSGYMDSQCLYY